MFNDQRFCPTMTVLKGEGRNTLGSSLRPEVRFLIILAIFPLCADLLTFPDFAWNSGLPAIGCSFAHVVCLQLDVLLPMWSTCKFTKENLGVEGQSSFIYLILHFYPC